MTDVDIIEGKDQMKDERTLQIRYFGADWNRYHCLQRGDGTYWTGDSWSRVLDCAKIFRQHRDAQQECVILYRRQYGGKPLRTFRLEVDVALVADDVQDITKEKLAEFIAQAVRIDVETIFGDGPVEGSFVQLRFRLKTLEEIESTRKRF